MKRIKGIPKRVTSELLRAMCACREERECFEKMYPRGCAITAENVEELYNEGLNVWWFCSVLSDIGMFSTQKYSSFCREMERLGAEFRSKLDRVKERHKSLRKLRDLADAMPKQYRLSSKQWFALLKLDAREAELRGEYNRKRTKLTLELLRPKRRRAK